MYSKIWWKYSVATLGLLAFSLILTYQKPTVRKYQAWHRDLTQDSSAPPATARIQTLTSSMQEIMAFYVLEQGLAVSSPEEPSAEQSSFLMGLKRDFFEKLAALEPLIAELPRAWQPEYRDKRDILIFRARLFSRTYSESPAWAHNFVELMSEEDLEQTLSSREHATLIRVAIEKTLTFHIAAIAVYNTLDMQLKEQITLQERSALVRHAHESKANIVTLKQEEPTLGLVSVLKQQHNAAASLFEFTHASAHID